MNVKDLIAKLEKEDPKAIVILQTANTMEIGQELVELDSVQSSKTGGSRIKKCRDAFDDEGGPYDATVWNMFHGKKSVVALR